MSRAHLRFKRIHKGVQSATIELMSVKPWSADVDEEVKQAAFERWLRRASDAYGVPAPTLEIVEQREPMNYALGQITLSGYSMLFLFMGHRYHQQAMGTVSLPDEDLANFVHSDAVGWACSLFYLVRPRMFRQSVRRGKIPFVHPDDLLSSATLAARHAEAIAAQDDEGWEDEDPEVQEAIVNALLDEDDDVQDDEAGETPVAETADVIDPYMTTAEAAAFLCLSRSTITNMINDGRLQAVRVGRLWKVARASVGANGADRAEAAEQ